ncbi:MAG TPA: hypothetical protein VNA13_02290 [Xanthomonadales bacterium]|nr:hypothetical protein [Xanthomonadales bacterium]
MNKKLLKQLLLISYKNGELDNKTIAKISEKLDRTQLKQYIKALKSAEKLHNVYVETPFAENKTVMESFKSIFPDKKIKNLENSSLIVGTKISYNDDIFEVSLKNNLDQIVRNIEDYD